MPSIVTGNCRSLRNKLDELKACLQYRYEYRESCLLCFTETWFSSKDTTADTDMDGFVCVRGDRTEASGKLIGGGVCAYVNERWCNESNIKIKESYCSENIELLCFASRPHYLPREFSNIYITVVYIQPTANVDIAASEIQNISSRIATSSPDAVQIVLGDFNSCDLRRVMPHMYQYVNIPTRGTRTLDKCYGNVKDGYKALAKPPLGNSDHNIIQLIPQYRQKLRRHKPTTKKVKVWTKDTTETLEACFDCTDWEVLLDSSSSLDEAAEVVTSYIQFCEDMLVSEKTFKQYPNNKPWIDKRCRQFINQKTEAFHNSDRDAMKNIEKDFKRHIVERKREFGKKIESKFQEGNPREAWKGLKLMTGFGDQKKQCSIIGNDVSEFVQNLNEFYCRFDKNDQALLDSFLHCQQEIQGNRVNSDRILIDAGRVKKVMESIKINKSVGPDGLSGKLLKTCSEQLFQVFCRLFQWSMDTSHIPDIWKCATVIPIPKAPKPVTLNDYRPVALTPIIMKCFEKLVKVILVEQTKVYQDPLQFAYRSGRGVDDALTYLLHIIIKHLEQTKSYVRVLYIDFSSAFNTIVPEVLIEKLHHVMKVNPYLSLWIGDFMSNRSQRVRLGEVFSDSRTLNVGAPQGCVLSPILFTLLTSDSPVSPSCHTVKYADDTCIVGLISDNEETMYRECVDNFVEWCQQTSLILNARKTKEMIFDFRIVGRGDHDSISIGGEVIDQVPEYKYLGTVIDDRLNWDGNTSKLQSKGNQRMYFLRKLKSFNVRSQTLALFYQSVIQSVICFSSVAWFCGLTEKNKSKLTRVVSQASKITGMSMQQLEDIVQLALLTKLDSIMEDESHPLHEEVTINRSGRIRLPKTRTERYRRSFLISASRAFNSKFKR